MHSHCITPQSADRIPRSCGSETLWEFTLLVMESATRICHLECHSMTNTTCLNTMRSGCSIFMLSNLLLQSSAPGFASSSSLGTSNWTVTGLRWCYHPRLYSTKLVHLSHQHNMEPAITAREFNHTIISFHPTFLALRAPPASSSRVGGGEGVASFRVFALPAYLPLLRTFELPTYPAAAMATPFTHIPVPEPATLPQAGPAIP